MATFGTMTYFLKVGQSPKVHFGTASWACSQLINQKKKSYGHQLGPMTQFFDEPKI